MLEHLELELTSDEPQYLNKEQKRKIEIKKQGIIDQIQKIIDANVKYKNGNENIVSIIGHWTD